MQYQFEATSLTGFIQQIAVGYLRHGYHYYVVGGVPEGKDPRSIDKKLMDLYEVGWSKTERWRRKHRGLGNVQYLRFERVFVLMATEGEHQFFARERNVIRDARKTPLRLFGYSMGVRHGHVQVRIDLDEYRRLRARFWEMATRRKAEVLAREFYTLPFEPYAPIRRQLLNILRLVNKRRQVAGYRKLPYSVLRLRRRIVKVFDRVEVERAA